MPDPEPVSPPATRPLSDREWLSFQLLCTTTWRAAAEIDGDTWLEWRSRFAGFTSSELEHAVAELAVSPFLPTWAMILHAARPARRRRYAQWWEAQGA